MPMPDWKNLIETREERLQAGLGVALCVLLLGGVVYFLPNPTGNATADLAAVAATATTTLPDAYAHIALTGKAAIVLDLSTGLSLYENNADAQLPLASLTKLLTTYAAASVLSPTTPVFISDTASAQDGDSGLSIGERFNFRDLARFALVASSNDAAEAILETAALHRNEDPQTLLKDAAADAGLTETYAINGTGLDESDTVSGGYGSPRDVARLAGALLAKAPDIARATTEPSITVTSLDGVKHSLPNTDVIVDEFPNLLISKTGYTDLAGGNLAIVFDAALNHPIAVVVLGSTEEARFTDVATLVNATLAHFAGTEPQ